ncbi:MAG: hypothetical protein LBK68_00035 [Candidatus Margulisbacteria bacterium]|jgi:hypothetical protein|nr:hypothetical protein [Candidatus Margulisiibacteriota bacterium]
MTRTLHTEVKSGKPLVATDITDLTFFPIGSILMMDGSWTDGRGNWYICDGRDTPHGKTPNLVNLFILGAVSSGTIGGSSATQSVTLTAENLPSHKHSITDTTHTHVQNSHNHTQNSHNHTQNSHSHTQNEHNHVQNPHNHTQNSHGHTDNGHTHTFQNSVDETDGYDVTLQGNPNYTCRTTSVSTGYASIKDTTATNIEATAINNAVAATNQVTTATNQAATATNMEATAVNQAAGTGLTETEATGNGSPITINAVLPPYYTVIYIKKMA